MAKAGIDFFWTNGAPCLKNGHYTGPTMLAVAPSDTDMSQSEVLGTAVFTETLAVECNLLELIIALLIPIAVGIV